MTEDDSFNTSDLAREAFAALIDAFMPLAQGLVLRDGSFTPFAGYLDAEGEPQGLSVKLEEGDAPAPDRIVAALEGALRERAASGGVQAVVIFADIHLRPRHEDHSDAILGRFEHSDGSSFRLFYRYGDGEDGRTVFRDPSGAPETPAGLTSRRH